MQQKPEYSGYSSFLKLLLFSAGLLLMASCNLTRNLPENKYLLDKTRVKLDDTKQKTVRSGEVEGFIRQKPNKKIVGTRFHLRVYNSARNVIPGFSRWLRKIGEEPVILDTMLTQQSVTNIKRFLENKGYFSSSVHEVTKLDSKKRKAIVTYDIQLGDPHRISTISYLVEDTTIRSLVLSDTLNRLISRNSRFDMDVLQNERKRIENLLKEQGYFFFSHDFINFDADTTRGSKKVDLTLNLRNRFTRNVFGERIVHEYRKYKINKVFIVPRYDPISHFNLKTANLLDTVYFENEIFVFSNDPGVRLRMISDANLLKPGQTYSESMVFKSFSNLSSLRLFRLVNIYFEPDESEQNARSSDETFLLFTDEGMEQTENYGKLNCYIQLTPHTLQSFQTELVGTNSSSDYGFESNVNYQHKNLFRGAEVFDLKLRGSLGFEKKTNQINFKQQTELGVSSSVTIPRFLSPFAGNEYLRTYSPQTQVSVSYNFSDRPNYTRTVIGSSFGYHWKDAKYLTHSISLAEVSMINIFAIDSAFLSRISNTYLANSYKNQLVTTSGYSLIYNNQPTNKNVSFTAIRFNIESSGILLNAFSSLQKIEPIKGSYQILGISFSQFVKTDINAVYTQIVDRNNTFVYRAFAGIGLPYGNSRALPFEKKYFSGGSSGVRAWHARNLGPGSFVEENVDFPDQTADVKLEANLEYRFKVIEMLEGALFVDAGNIWAISKNDERPGALFKLNSFYKQIALGTGMGVRVNLGFFVMRVDVGVKVFDPGIRITQSPIIGEPPTVTGSQWIPFSRGYKRSDFAYHIGIGYPF